MDPELVTRLAAIVTAVVGAKVRRQLTQTIAYIDAQTQGG